MPNGNLKHEVECPSCKEKRLVRSDVVAKLTKSNKPLICKPCHNRSRFDGRSHPRKGTGIKNNPDLLRTRNSYYKAKQRCKLGVQHHPCYENVEFRFASLQDLINCIGLRQEGMTLDRINPLGHYEAGNVRWATMSQQNANRLPRGYWKS
jgi:hypothetical protein